MTTFLDCEVTVLVIEADLTLTNTNETGPQMQRRQVNRLVMTLLDPNAYPADALIRLYHERWETELVYREFKSHHARWLRAAFTRSRRCRPRDLCAADRLPRSCVPRSPTPPGPTRPSTLTEVASPSRSRPPGDLIILALTRKNTHSSIW